MNFYAYNIMYLENDNYNKTLQYQLLETQSQNINIYEQTMNTMLIVCTTRFFNQLIGCFDFPHTKILQSN